MFFVESCACFQSFEIHNNMNVKSATKKLQIIAREKEAHRSEHKQRQEEETELLKITKVEEELKRAERESMLNIQLLVVKSLLHSSSSLECVEGKVYNEKIQFAQIIIQDIDSIKTFVVDFFAQKQMMLACKKAQDQELHQQIQCLLKNWRKMKL